jgi:MFS transporter, DHA1 family, tetracycline resistance protein
MNEVSSLKTPPRNTSTGIIFLTIFLDLLGYGLVIPLLPNFARTLGASALVIGVVLAVYSFAQFIFGPVLGSLSDRFGRRPVLLCTIAVSVVAYLLFGISTTLVFLLISRTLAGCAAGNLSVAQAYIVDVTPPENRAKALGLVGAALGLGFIFGPPIGGAVKEYLGMNWVGYVGAILAGINFIVAFFALSESHQGSRPDSPIRFLDTAVLQSVRESPQLSRLFGVFFLFTLAFTFLQITGALLWRDRFALSDAQIGYTFALIGVVSAVVQTGLIGLLVPRFGERNLLLFGLLCMAIGILLMPFVAPNQFLPWEALLIVVFGFGYALVIPTGTALVSRDANSSSQGQMLGQYQSIGALARIIGPLAAGALYGWRIESPYLVGGVVMVIALAASVGIEKPK